MADGPIEHEIEVTETAQQRLLAIRDNRIRKKISDAVDDLKNEPLKRSDPLQDDLAGLHSKRAVGQRYRIIFSIDDACSPPKLIVRAVGIRKNGDKKDIYAMAAKMRARGEI